MLEILICSFNKGIVRAADVLLPPRPDVRYYVSYQYNDERYLDLVPDWLRRRSDVTYDPYFGEGLSRNRNHALDYATGDFLLFADDDARLLPETPDVIARTFAENANLDVAFFQATTYTGKPLKAYPESEFDVTAPPEAYTISALEMVVRREAVQRRVRFNEQFGLGTKFLTCGEEEIWLEDALRAGLRMRYFPEKIVETSTMLKKNLVYVDAGVQRSRGAICFYLYGRRAWWKCFRFAFDAARHGRAHFLPLMRHFAEGIRCIRRD